MLAAAARLGYRPDSTARALRSGRTQQLGVVVGEHLSYLFDNPQAAEFLAGIADVCVSEDLGVVLIPTRGDADDVNRVLAAAVDGSCCGPPSPMTRCWPPSRAAGDPRLSKAVPTTQG